MIDLDALLALVEECTPGPWEEADEDTGRIAGGQKIFRLVVVDDSDGDEICSFAVVGQFTDASDRVMANREFVAKSREAVPELIRLLLEAREEIARVQKIADSLAERCHGQSELLSKQAEGGSRP